MTPLKKMPQLMGILNVTPDSFSDGGKFLSASKAVDHALKMVSDGAKIIDIGAESTRPGSKGVPDKEQLRRILSVLHRLRKQGDCQISIDTQSAAVAEVCLDEGADIINDISALRHDSTMAELLARKKCYVILMHMKGTPATMQKSPRYKNVVREIITFFHERIQYCQKAGITKERIWIDPGIGFGKTFDHNIEILQRLNEFKALRRPLVVGASRKSFLGKITNELRAERRISASVAAGLFAALNGADVLRVHDVFEHRSAFEVLQKLTAN